MRHHPRSAHKIVMRMLKELRDAYFQSLYINEDTAILLTIGWTDTTIKDGTKTIGYVRTKEGLDHFIYQHYLYLDTPELAEVRIPFASPNMVSILENAIRISLNNARAHYPNCC